MKTIFKSLLFFLFATIFFTSCQKEDVKIKKLNHGDGKWSIESVHYEFYDSLGVSVVSDSTVTKPGELVFFSTNTLNAIWGYYLVVGNLTDSNGNTYVCREEIYFDGDRANLQQTNSGDPCPYLGLWTVNESSRHKQDWSAYQLRGDGTLWVKTTMVLKKE